MTRLSSFILFQVQSNFLSILVFSTVQNLWFGLVRFLRCVPRWYVLVMPGLCQFQSIIWSRNSRVTFQTSKSWTWHLSRVCQHLEFLFFHYLSTFSLIRQMEKWDCALGNGYIPVKVYVVPEAVRYISRKLGESLLKWYIDELLKSLKL